LVEVGRDGAVEVGTFDQGSHNRECHGVDRSVMPTMLEQNETVNPRDRGGKKNKY
jgi:hypothetical protein